MSGVKENIGKRNWSAKRGGRIGRQLRGLDQREKQLGARDLHPMPADPRLGLSRSLKDEDSSSGAGNAY